MKKTNLLHGFFLILLAASNCAAQSSLPPCPETGYKHNCVGEQSGPEGRNYAGEWKNGKLDGQGTVSRPDGIKYVGGFKGGMPDGEGILTMPDSQYVGEFKGGVMSGQGTRTWPDGTKHVGQWADGKANGHGTYTSKIYVQVGWFKDGRLNGEGTLTGTNGSKYAGEFKDGNVDGQGTLTFTNGRTFIGKFKDGKQHGEGVRYDEKGAILETGVWENGKHVAGTIGADFKKNSEQCDRKSTYLYPESIRTVPTGQETRTPATTRCTTYRNETTCTTTPESTYREEKSVDTNLGDRRKAFDLCMKSFGNALPESLLNKPERREDPRVFKDCNECPSMLPIPLGSFQMGGGEKVRTADSHGAV